MVDEVGHASHPAGHGGQTGACPLGEGVGEGLGEGGEGIDVQRVIEAVHIGHPPREADLLLHAQGGRQVFQLVHLLAVPRDKQAQPGAALMGAGEAADQSGNVLHGVQSGRDARDDAVVRPVGPHARQVLAPAHGGGAGGKVDAVIDGEEPVRVEATGDKQIHHRVGHADAVVQPTQGQGVDGAVGRPGEGPAHVIQTVVGVYGGHHRQAGGPAEQGAHHVAPGAVAVDDVVPALPNQLFQGGVGPQNVAAGKNHSGDAQGPGLLGKGTLHKADHGDLHAGRAAQILQEHVYVGLGAAAVAAGN